MLLYKNWNLPTKSTWKAFILAHDAVLAVTTALVKGMIFYRVAVVKFILTQQVYVIDFRLQSKKLV